MKTAQPILIIRVHYMTPKEQLGKFNEVMAAKFSDYNVLILASAETELQFETHNVNGLKPITTAVFKKLAIKQFEELKASFPEVKTTSEAVDVKPSLKKVD
jgi:hypothetical protein